MPYRLERSAAEHKVAMKAGTLIQITQGEYSDFGHVGHFVALQDVTVQQMYALQSEVNDEAHAIEEREGWCDPQPMFMAAMIRQGWLLDVHVTSVHIGSWGDLELTL